MPLLTRRHFGLGAMAMPAIVAGSTLPAFAETSTAVPPGLFTAPLGKYQITSIFDGMGPLQRNMFIGAEDKIDAVLKANGITGDAMPAPINAFLMQSEDQTILIDAGMGGVEMLGPGLGRTSDALVALGVAPEDIDLVIVTHAHPDHIGGLIGSNGAVFPNAEIVVSDTEHAFWTDDSVMAQAPDEAKGLFQLAKGVFDAYSDRVRKVSSGTEVAPGITMELSPGHTPGHALVHIDGGDRELLMVADTLHSSVLHTALPETGFGFDTDPALAATSRQIVFDRAATDNLLIAATHVPFPGFGRFVREGDAYRYAPASWT